jgi:hypothetical protein
VKLKIKEMSGKKLLEYAGERIFSLGLRDLAHAVSHRNMLYGLGKMLYVSNEDVFCVFGPDATITRNKKRWTSGFGYGGVIKWFEEGIIFPEMRPNGCGMVLAKLEELPERRELLEGIARLNEEGLELEGFEIKPDFGKGNHFFEIYKALEVSPEVQKTMSSPYYAILHCSSPERKGEIYGKVDEGEWMKTPLGRISILADSAAKEYLRLWEDYDSFCKKRRAAIVKEVLEDSEVILDKIHQGLSGMNEIRLGCYNTMDMSGDSSLFPIALRWDMPVYIMKGNPNLSEEAIARMGFRERAERLELLEELRGINILPHGGGYEISIPYTEVEVIQQGEDRFFILKESKIDQKITSRYGEIAFTNPRELPFNYRGKDVIEKTMEYDLGKLMAKLQPMITLKV